jgi:site-specific DNA-methyltransferase (adenine-specific)
MPPKPVTENTLFYGDNLPILREYVPTESVDLVYLDPPFNSNRSYNVLFRDESGHDSESQIVAFDDTWHWGDSAEQTYHDLVNDAPAHVGGMIGALRQFIGANQMMAYLVMMAARLVELHRVLKPTGSLYLHCDPTASHYLKVVLDTIMRPENFRNEVVWMRSLSKGLMTRKLPDNHDVLLAYQKTAAATWNAATIFRPYDLDNLDEKTAGKYTQRDPDGRLYQLDNITNPNPDRPNLTYEFLGVTKVWRWTKERMQAAYEAGLVIQPRPGAVPRLKRYLDEQRGKPLGDVWTDIPPINSQAAERLGYPTQKPLALLERIIQASSNPGDVVLDPFCGCGTAVAAAQKLERRWIGIDITHLSISLQKYRLAAMFPGLKFQVIGEPEDLGAARQLAGDDRYQFQWWALSLIRAKPLGGQEGSKAGKKGSDRGVDGVITFIDDNTGKPKRALVQVKSGHINAGDVRDLIGTVEQEKAALGLFITLEPPSAPMETAAVTAGYYHSPGWNQDYRRIQILTIESLLKGAQVQMPPTAQTFKLAPKAEPARPDDQLNLGV